MVEEIFEKKIKLFKKTKETKLTNKLAPKKTEQDDDDNMSNQMIRNKVKQGPSLVYPNVVVYFGSTSIFLNLRKKNRSSYCHLFSLIYIILEIFFFEVRSEIFDFT